MFNYNRNIYRIAMASPRRVTARCAKTATARIPAPPQGGLMPRPSIRATCCDASLEASGAVPGPTRPSPCGTRGRAAGSRWGSSAHVSRQLRLEAVESDVSTFPRANINVQSGGQVPRNPRGGPLVPLDLALSAWPTSALPARTLPQGPLLPMPRRRRTPSPPTMTRHHWAS